MPFLSIQNGERKLYYTSSSTPETLRDGSRPTLVFVHGLGSSSSFFAPIIPAITAAGYACLALDTHGMGISPFAGPDGGDEQIIKDTAEAMQAFHLSHNRTIIVGHSLGGHIASEIALRYPVAGAILLGPWYPNRELAHIFQTRIKVVEEQGLDGAVDIVLASATGPKATPLQRAFIRTLILSSTPEGYTSACNTLMNSQRPDYSKITCPVLIIAGTHDRTTPLATSETILNSWGCTESQKKIVVLDIAHWHCIEAPEEVTAATLDFLGDLKF
ncbi:hypothetical protein PT974_06477 [Cladobotryum mycophilum]|uniref:Serine aminopeptidase S33 domain-containing protein n=1 Tax=Cladobotryum mycophilum TaxID=491253 RepID=A0ABR0SMR8_9HYPO